MARENSNVSDLLKQLQQQTLPVAIDNIHQAIVDGDLRQSQKMVEGLGVYRSHKSIDAQVTQTKIEIRLVTQRPAHLDPNAPLPQVKPGSSMVGRPAIDLLPVKVE